MQIRHRSHSTVRSVNLLASLVVVGSVASTVGCTTQLRPEQVGLKPSASQAEVNDTGGSVPSGAGSESSSPTAQVADNDLIANEYGLGTAVRQGRWKLALERVADPAHKSIKKSFVGKNERPVSVQARLRNMSEGPADFTAKECVVLADDSGKHYRLSHFANGKNIDAKGMPSNAERDGSLTFVVSKVARNLTLVLGCDTTHPWAAGSLDPVQEKRADQEKAALTPKRPWDVNSAGEYYDQTLAKPVGTTVAFGNGWEAVVHKARHAYNRVGWNAATHDGTHDIVLDIELFNKSQDKRRFAPGSCLMTRDEQGRSWATKYSNVWGKSLPGSFAPDQRGRGTIVLRSPNNESVKQIMRLGCTGDDTPAYVMLPTSSEPQRP